MTGDKNGSGFEYINRVGYDKFERRTFIEYGNGTRMEYSYDSLRRRLSALRATTSGNEDMMNNSYSYDAVDNILSLTNASSANVNNIGGSMTNTYVYDSLYRLDSSVGTSELTADVYDYQLKMNYSLSGKIVSKTQSASLNNNTIPGLSYDLDYQYTGDQPHAPSYIGSDHLSYDHNGNLLTSYDSVTARNKIFRWDEENRMKLTTGSGSLGYYLYDAKGERTLKLLSDYQQLQINDSTTLDAYVSGFQALYVNPYLVVNPREYTKHYYIENQRIASKIGGGFQNSSVPLFSQVYGFNRFDEGKYREKKLQDEAMINRDLDSCGMMMGQGLYDFLIEQSLLDEPETAIYFYHPDHLGSSSYLSDNSGLASQHIDYLPFGEVLLEEVTATWKSPYKFNAKELDEESGLYYYGARYYDPVTSVFLGVDPLADSFPSWSPYRYCFDNPINVTDKSGLVEDGFVATWDEVKKDYNTEKVNDKGGSKTDYTEYHGGPLEGKMIVRDRQSGASQMQDISTSEISPVTGAYNAKGALNDANWIIDLVAGAGVGGIMKSGAKAAGKELFKFSAKAAENMTKPGRAVPIQILKQAINGSKGVADPQGSRALMHTVEMWKNGKAYNLDVLYDKASNSIWHFQYY
jgi:RHS repeat-associated protein